MRCHLCLVILGGYLTILQIQEQTVEAYTRGGVGRGHSPMKSSLGWGRSHRKENSYGRAMKPKAESKPMGRNALTKRALSTLSSKKVSAKVCKTLQAYPHPNRCDAYTNCETSSNTLSWVVCPEGNYFNSDAKKCEEGNCRYESFPGEAQWENGFLTHPSCNMYYTTQSRNFKMILAEHKCKTGEHFNNETNQCVAGDCAAKPPPTDLPTTAPEGFTQLNCLGYNRVPHPTKCDMYVTCDKAANKVSYAECGPNSHFDRKIKDCAAGTCRYEAYPGECEGERANSFHPDPTCNTKYIECLNRAAVFIVVERECESGLIYSDKDKKCVAGQAEQCTGYIPDTDPETEPTPKPTPKPAPAPKPTPAPAPAPKPTPAPAPTTKKPSGAVITPTPAKEPTDDGPFTNNNSSEATCTAMDGTPHPTKCNSYYQCKMESKKFNLLITDCGPKMYYDVAERKCMDGVCHFESYAGQCHHKDKNVAHQSCNKYQQCKLNGGKYILIERSCDANTHFDAGSGKCVSGQCTPPSPVPPEPTEAPTNFTVTKEECVAYHGMVHPTKCDSYYDCNFNTNVVSWKTCPKGTHYDSKWMQCLAGSCRHEKPAGECGSTEGEVFPGVTCNKYRSCENRDNEWSIISHTCPQGLLFSAATKSCSAKSECTGGGSSSDAPDNNDCQIYPWECTKSKPCALTADGNTTIPCPVGGQDPARCPNSPKKPTPAPTPAPSKPTSKPTAVPAKVTTPAPEKKPSDDGPYTNGNSTRETCTALDGIVHPTKCNKYYHCEMTGDKFTLFIKDCGPKMYYDAKERKCMDGACHFESYPGQCHHKEGNVAHQSCEKYQQCKLNAGKYILIERSCEAKTHFDAGSGKCVSGQCTPPSVIPPEPTEPPKNFTVTKEECAAYQGMVHPTKCDSYYHCNVNTTVVSWETCPKGTHYEVKYAQCLSGSCRHEKPAGECGSTSGEFLPGETCSTYKKCVNNDNNEWLMITRTCPKGTLFSIASKSCSAKSECVDGGGGSSTPVTPDNMDCQIYPWECNSSPPCALTADGNTTIPCPVGGQDPARCPNAPKKPTPAPTPEPEMSDEDCDPNNCTIVGQCNTYKYCKGIKNLDLPPDRQTGKLLKAKCDVGLWFNPDSPAVSAQDGTAAVCDNWLNIKEDVRTNYLDLCTCNYFELSPCSQEYIFQDEMPEGSGNFKNTTRTCPPELLWNQPAKTCSFPCNVKNSAGEPCGTCADEEP